MGDTFYRTVVLPSFILVVVLIKFSCYLHPLMTFLLLNLFLMNNLVVLKF